MPASSCSSSRNPRRRAGMGGFSMSSCRTLFAPALLALAVGLAHPQTVQADTSPTSSPIQFKIQVSPPCVQPGGLVHVLIEPVSPPSGFSFFDLYPELHAHSHESIFDFYGDNAPIDAFFDIFTEMALQPGQTSPTTHKLTVLNGMVSRKSISIMMRMELPTAGSTDETGDGTIVLQGKGGLRLATCPVMLYGPTSPRGHVLASCQAISSFFDIWTEIAIDEPGVSLTVRRR